MHCIFLFLVARFGRTMKHLVFFIVLNFTERFFYFISFLHTSVLSVLIHVGEKEFAGVETVFTNRTFSTVEASESNHLKAYSL